MNTPCCIDHALLLSDYPTFPGEMARELTPDASIDMFLTASEIQYWRPSGDSGIPIESPESRDDVRSSTVLRFQMVWTRRKLSTGPETTLSFVLLPTEIMKLILQIPIIRKRSYGRRSLLPSEPSIPSSKEKLVRIDGRC